MELSERAIAGIVAEYLSISVEDVLARPSDAMTLIRERSRPRTDPEMFDFALEMARSRGLDERTLHTALPERLRPFIDSGLLEDEVMAREELDNLTSVAGLDNIVRLASGSLSGPWTDREWPEVEAAGSAAAFLMMFGCEDWPPGGYPPWWQTTVDHIEAALRSRGGDTRT